MQASDEPDLDGMLSDVQRRGKEIESKLIQLLTAYENFHREGSRLLNQERSASDGSMVGLDGFHRFVQTIRRNKDVVGSMVRGISNLRPLTEFKVVVEDDEKPGVAKPVKAAKSTKPARSKNQARPGPEILEPPMKRDLEPEHRIEEPDNVLENLGFDDAPEGKAE